MKWSFLEITAFGPWNLEIARLPFLEAFESSLSVTLNNLIL